MAYVRSIVGSYESSKERDTTILVVDAISITVVAGDPFEVARIPKYPGSRTDDLYYRRCNCPLSPSYASAFFASISWQQSIHC